MALHRKSTEVNWLSQFQGHWSKRGKLGKDIEYKVPA